MNSTFQLDIYTPEKHFFSGECESFVMTGLDGEICIMKNHAPMVAALNIGSVRLKCGGEWKDAFNSEGFVEVSKNCVKIFTQACEWPEDIDEARAERARERAIAEKLHAESVSEHKRTEIALTRAMARLSLKNRHYKSF